MPAKKRPIKKSKTKVAMSSTIDLILDGTVYAVKYNAQKKIISKIELDSKVVLKTLVCVLTKTAKKETMNPEIYFAYLVHVGKRKLKLDWLFYQDIRKQYVACRKKYHIYELSQKWASFSVDKMRAFFETHKVK